MRNILSRLSYANVVATLALFIALGGASYGITALPAGSVGQSQLKPRAVTPGKLAFPLGASGTTDQTREDLKKDGCDGPLPPGQVLNVDCPLQVANGARIPRLGNTREVTIHVSSPGKLVVTGLAGLRNEGPANTSATVTAALAVDGAIVARPSLGLSGQASSEIPLAAALTVGAGTHRVAVAFAVRYVSYLPGDVFVSPVTLIASTLPRS